ncbi:SIS domain-containing protein (plasmid) [Rhizobium leguminosarum]|jgi:glucosamine--fructose-6-phosphate aminotransferase (isomerizing)|uniref:Glucosamine-fructose-6-phosphate aminotransferase n=3 Tax=Rhizobium TaxID=379 RepID=A0A1B8RHT0_RHILT|nr:SIS domain-containing protein [Rhizobium leguminosarum]AOO88485.1 glucosamine-fructose-6-phosphate aminotransferase [Rhizobium leguminosarum bv. trifolii]ASS58698.1 SIS domain-containing protein [Rhizobium leguminosarum bv. viciae]MBB4330534.1 glucosamine--fructose-6-phosphate aminotransferase (isomerizing) [Rhizobium leguminosarum]MBB4339601.1 glucosamine--fructose-6-phosphate aminotransferase (isomerizing) [Rhizobium leguminosarum]MBB4355714.1 glucosamine--fructose-6-phosphate aminotransf
MNTTEKVIFEQFPYWEKAIGSNSAADRAELLVFVGCGTSFNLALSLAAYANLAGRKAIAVPGAEWQNRPSAFWPEWRNTHVVALSRSGETTETVAAAKASRAAGAFVTAITVEPESTLAKNCDRMVAAETHPDEGIVMTVSASLMVLLGLQMIGQKVPVSVVNSARQLATALDAALPGIIADRSHFVFLGGGPLFGVALEGALKLMEMSQIMTQAFHPLEYRHGPISLVDGKTVAVMLYSSDQREAETKLVGELREKGAVVIGVGGPGDLELAVDVDLSLAGLVVLPALQVLGERAAQARQIDTVSPRHLTKVVTLA